MKEFTIAILEDNTERIEAMRERLNDRMPMYRSYFTNDPRDLLQFIQIHQGNILAVSLDHDLNEVDFSPLDLTGMDAVKGLENMPPEFPVIVHSTNALAVEKMMVRLENAGYSVGRVIPFDGVNWIRTEWFQTLRRMIHRNAEPLPFKTPLPAKVK